MNIELTSVGNDDVLISLLIRQVESRLGGGYLDRPTIQRLCYFGKIAGVPFEARFRLHYYGPYSEELSATLDRLVSEDAIVEARDDGREWTNLRSGAKLDSVLSAGHDAMIAADQRLEKFADWFGQGRKESLELASTLHFVEQKLKASGDVRYLTFENLVNGCREIKGDRFSEWEIRRAYDDMASLGVTSALESQYELVAG